ncbi:MAG: hypothetical protein HC828_08675, partial [Blastochloris sp.]|nr:hypothetical protein [Blastochloris sp.]
LNIPGIEDDNDGDTGEKRQTIYRWPHIHHEDEADAASSGHTESRNGVCQLAADDTYQKDKDDIYSDNQHTIPMIADSPEQPEKVLAESLQVASNRSLSQSLHAGGYICGQ